jgi:hypothetical protein
VIKTLETQLGQFLLGCKCPVSRFLPGRAKDLSAPMYIQSVPRVRDVIWKEGKLILRLVETFSYLSQKTERREINWRRRENAR